jgi:branched-chain amino acid aminotransferase
MGFAIKETKYRYRAFTKDGEWVKGTLTDNPYVTIHEASNVLHYGQAIFEGMKAYKTKDGRVHLFRPQLNYQRLVGSCERLVMKSVPESMFFDAIEQVVKANIDDVPEYGSGKSLYIRPFINGVGMNLGVKPSIEYMFGVFCSPVGSYFPGGLKALDFITTNYDRAATNGTGKAKAAGNYAASLLPRELALKNGYSGVIYLDPATHTYIDEVGAANFFGVDQNGVVVTPKSSSILESITRRSILYLAEHRLGLKTEERSISIDELHTFKEAAACGTAAIITPLKSVKHKENIISIGNGEVGPITKQLYDLLVGIYYGDIDAPEGWMYTIKK